MKVGRRAVRYKLALVEAWIEENQAGSLANDLDTPAAS